METIYVFQAKGKRDLGFAVEREIYKAVIATIDYYANQGDCPGLPVLLKGDPFRSREFKLGELGPLKEDLKKAGRIILQHPLLEKYPIKGRGSHVVLAHRYHTPKLAVRIATAIELCDKCIRLRRNFCIKVQAGGKKRQKTELEKLINQREGNWLYRPGSTDVFDHERWA